ncbi:MAG: hypothetical protein OHK0039_06720 [Bacteroidia bacterium]
MYFSHVTFQPRVGVFLSPRLMVAAQADWGVVWGGLEVPVQKGTYYGLGYLVRVYAGFRHPAFLPQPGWFSALDLPRNLRFFLEVGHHLGSGYQRNDSILFLSRPRIHEVQVGLGINYRIFRQLHIELTPQWAGRPDPAFSLPTAFGIRLGLDYFLEPKRTTA